MIRQELEALREEERQLVETIRGEVTAQVKMGVNSRDRGVSNE
jgi:hypothetical protein